MEKSKVIFGNVQSGAVYKKAVKSRRSMPKSLEMILTEIILQGSLITNTLVTFLALRILL